MRSRRLQVDPHGGQAMIHTSGCARCRGPRAGPGRRNADQVVPPRWLPSPTPSGPSPRSCGATVAIEGDDQLALLAEMAERIGARAVRLTPGSKPAYHAAAVLAAGGFVALLDAIAELGRVAGLDEAGALAIYGPLIEGTLGTPVLGIVRGPDRADHARRRRHAAGPPGRARGPCARRRRVVPRCRARDQLAEAWHPDTGRRINSALVTCIGRVNRYHCWQWSTALPPSTRPGRLPDRPTLGPHPGAAGPPRDRHVPRVRRSRHRPSPGRSRAARPDAGELARSAPPFRSNSMSGRPRPQVTMHWPRSGAPGGTPPAPLRRRGTPEERDGHVRWRRRDPVSRIEPPVRCGLPPSRARRTNLDTAEGHAERR